MARCGGAAVVIVLATVALLGLAIGTLSPAVRTDPARALLAAWRGARYLGPGEGILQRSFNDCGPAALAHALGELGLDVAYPDPGGAIELGDAGCSFEQLIDEARRRGVQARAVFLEPEGLVGLSAPAILHLAYGHFVVYEGWGPGGRILIHDPGLGRLSYSSRALQRHWRGYLLLLEPAPRGPREGLQGGGAGVGDFGLK